MARSADRVAERRLPLSKERVLRTAMALADQGGIDSLSMRRLAQELGVEAMSLYHYVSSKDDILNGIVEIVVAEIEVPSGGKDWRAAVRSSAISFHDALARHRWAANLIMSGIGVGTARVRYMEALLGRLREAGFSANMTITPTTPSTATSWDPRCGRRAIRRWRRRTPAPCRGSSRSYRSPTTP